MTLDLTKPVATRDGRAAQILRSDVCNTDFPLAVLVTEADGTQNVWPYNFDGQRDAQQEEPNPNDLVNVSVVVQRFLNFYGGGGMAWATRQAADADCAVMQRVALIIVTYTDGVVTGVELA
jgi:hypothetical protein